MAFHAYDPPSDMVYFTPHARQYMFTDAQLVGGNVRFYLSYYGGPLMDQFDRPDGLWLKFTNFNNQFYAFGNGFTDQTSVHNNGKREDPDAYSPEQRIWTIASRQLYAASLVGWAPDFGFANADGTATVIAPSGGGSLGLSFRSGTDIGAVNCDYLCIDNASNKMKLIVNGTTVWTGTTTITPGNTYTIRGVVSSNTYNIYLNGTLEGTYTLTAGAQQANVANTRMGLRHSGDSTGRFTFFRYAPHGDPVPTTVTVRNFDGTVVYTALLPTNVGDHSILDIPDSALSQRGARGPYGWYRLYLTGADHGDGQWGTAYGDTSFCRLPDSSLQSNATYKRWEGYYVDTTDFIARRVFGIGPARQTPGDVSNRIPSDGVTTAGSPTVTSATANFTSADLHAPISDGSVIGGASHVKIPTNTYIGIINSTTSIGLSSSATANVPVNALASGTGLNLVIGNPVGDYFAGSNGGLGGQIRDQATYNTADGSGRARLMLGTFTAFAQGIEQSLTAVVNQLKPYIQVWEIMNEPDSTGLGSEPAWTQNVWIPARNAILAADPNALVVGPCMTSIGPTNIQNTINFVQALPGSGAHADGWSYHPYNNYQGELAMMRRNIGNFLAAVQGY